MQAPSFHKFWSNRTFQLFLLMTLALVIYGQHLWVRGFFQDGYLYTVLGKNAAELGHWLIPRQSETQFRDFFEHPPLFFILEGLFFKIVGVNFSSARFFAISWAILSIFFLFRFIKKWESSERAFFAGVSLILMPSLLKKIRFPNLDVPLMMSYSLCLFSYFEALHQSGRQKLIAWIKAGIFFGLALLLKGLAGLFLPFIILNHLLWTKSWRELRQLPLWLALFLGIGLFSLWPLTLLLYGKEAIFISYLKTQLYDTAWMARGGHESHFLTYFWHLFKYNFLWVLCAAIALGRKKWSRESRSLDFFALVWFLSLIIPLSFMRFKYSNYIIPLYPALALLASGLITELRTEARTWAIKGVACLTYLFTILTLMFPLTTKERRHKHIFYVVDTLKERGQSPKNWVVVDEAFGYWATSSIGSWFFHANPYRASLENIEETLKKLDHRKGTLVLVKEEDLEVVKSLLKKALERDPFVTRVPKKDLYFLSSD